MKLRTVMFGLAVLTLPACATVNIADMEPVATGSAQAPEVNVVVKASQKLHNEFVANDWVEPADAQMKQAAMTLLKGVDRTQKSPVQQYISRVSAAQLSSDIVAADYLAAQTRKAADVYFEYAEQGADITPTLQSLERALLDCRKAETTFTTAVKTRGYNQSQSNLDNMGVTIQSLQAGERVRSTKEAVLNAAIN